MQNISEHVSYEEATHTNTGLKNTPDEQLLENMMITAENIFEPLRKHFNVPIAITSFFRSEEVNKAVGGVIKSYINRNNNTQFKNNLSQHCYGYAMDLDANVYGKITNKDIFEYIKTNLTFDQLIWEFGTEYEPAWIHVSFRKSHNRNQILKSSKDRYGVISYKNLYRNK